MENKNCFICWYVSIKFDDVCMGIFMQKEKYITK